MGFARLASPLLLVAQSQPHSTIRLIEPTSRQKINGTTDITASH